MSMTKQLIVTVIATVTAFVAASSRELGDSEPNQKQRASEQIRHDLNAALERFYFYNARFATDFTDIESNDTYYPEAIPVDPMTGMEFEIHPVTHRVRNGTRTMYFTRREAGPYRQ